MAINPKKLKRIYAEVLSIIKPSADETLRNIANSNVVIEKLKRLVPSNVELVMVGSLSRGTNLVGNSDIDIFLLFDSRISKKKMEDMAMRAAKGLVKGTNGKFEVKYAEHPYARVYLENFNMKVDVVPAYKIANIENLATSVDRTPLHSRFINAHLTEGQKDEVRILKYLLRVHGIYGAEVKTKGFSGYLCEILIQQFGSLVKLMEEFSTIQLPICLYPKDRTISKDDSIFRKFSSRFVVIDPVDPSRNAAAGVSEESVAKLALIARRFVEKQSIELFQGPKFSSARAGSALSSLLKTMGMDLYCVMLNVPDKSEDVIWPQLDKAAKIIEADAAKQGFPIYLSTSCISGGKGILTYIAPNVILKTRLIKGPDVFAGKKHAFSFFNAHPRAIGKLVIKTTTYVIDKNRYVNFEQMLRSLVNGTLLKKRKDITFVRGKLFHNKLPKNIEKNVYESIRVALEI